MGLDIKYNLFTPLEQLFVDNISGNLLGSGYLLFFEDNQRTVSKKVYRITGSPPNYSYIEYGFFDITTNGWKVPLNDVGALEFNLYLYPYDDSDNITLYFCQCFNSGGILQFSREAIPNISAGTQEQNVSLNYIPNGQFLLHNNLPATTQYKINEIREPITVISQGGWTFDRPTTSTSVDFISFQRFGSAVINPISTPRYAVNIVSQTPDTGDIFKDIRIKFSDVNKFSSLTDKFTIGFSAISNGSGSINTEVILIKNFGTGGSSTTETVLGTFSVTNSYQPFFKSFVFGDNTSKTIGLLNDDYIQIAFRFPVNSAFDCSLTDILLTEGEINNPLFPYTTDGEFVNKSLSNGSEISGNNGEDLYLPILNGINGFYFDRGQIGKIFPCVYPEPEIGELLCDGTQYETSALSIDGIPYSRLQKKLFNTGFSVPIFGTGESYVTAVDFTTTTTDNFYISTNKIGAVTIPVNGLPSPTFTFTRIREAFAVSTPAFDYKCSIQQDKKVVCVCNTRLPLLLAPANGTSTLTITYYPITPALNFPLENNTNPYFVIDSTTFNILTCGGTYFEFSNTTINYYVWFKLDGVGTDPALPTKTGIQIDLSSTFNSPDVLRIICEILSMTLNGLDVTNVVPVSASSIPAGSYFEFESPDDLFYVWYTIDGVGIDPLVGGRKSIKVDLLSADTEALVTNKTMIAINSKYFAVPDLRGMILKGWSDTSTMDAGAPYRLSLNNTGGFNGNKIGTFEWDRNRSYFYNLPPLLYNQSFATSDPDVPIGQYYGSKFRGGPQIQYDPIHTGYIPNTNRDLEGSSQSRPRNIAVNYVIKY